MLSFENFRSDALSSAHQDEEQIRLEVIAFVNTLDRNTLIFIFDDWNFFMDNSTINPRVEATESALKQLVGPYHFVIKAFSARKQHIASRSANDDYFLYENKAGRLTEAEWTIWRNSPHFPLLNHLTNEQIENIAYLSGKIPLVLKTLHSYGVANIEDAITCYLRDETALTCGGGWIKKELQSFFNSVDDKNMNKFLELMSLAIIEAPCGAKSDYYDHRFFSSERSQQHGFAVIKPMNGFVAKLMTDIIVEDVNALSQYFTFADEAWAKHGMQSDNPSVKGFAFEFYGIKEFIHHLGGLQRVKIVRFEDDYPLQSDIERSFKTIVYWPYKWNLRHVDVVAARMVYKVDPPEKGTKRTRGGKAKKVANVNAYVQIGAQITLQTPVQHAASLQFYTEKHEGTEDFERYLTEQERAGTEAITFKFFWFVRMRLCLRMWSRE